MNRAIEAANKNIKRILKKMTDNYKGWHEQFPYALLGYCTTAKTSTGATTYLLVYGTEAVILAEVEIPSLRIILEAKLDNDEWVQARFEQLTLIDEKRMVAYATVNYTDKEWQEPSTNELGLEFSKLGRWIRKHSLSLVAPKEKLKEPLESLRDRTSRRMQGLPHAQQGQNF
ncbi:uncharacterized protein LOC132061197 [Lycium ferocissimum]|uniref:uncharacterized protein LOC132061197 n=1 Tax=Lycium ferocissimum TaxID=112874 RepID=UPI0028153D70|nr:uncharacterized protein LOC132061197 [Lycium ferocissimum]